MEPLPDMRCRWRLAAHLRLRWLGGPADNRSRTPFFKDSLHCTDQIWTKRDTRAPGTHVQVVALACARGGSKGLPGKNIRSLGGRPLIAWAIAQAKGVQRIGRV